MTPTRRPLDDRREERGIALLSVLLLLMLITALASALVVSGTTETYLARNHQSEAQAEAAAEAGLNHGVQVVITKLAAWQSDGYASAMQSANALLLGPDQLYGSTATDADNGRLDALGIPTAGIALTGVLNSRYDVRIMDEDDPARGTVPSNVTVAPVSENNVAVFDANERILVRSIGYSRDNTVVTLEAMISPGNTMTAIVTNGDLDVGGNAIVSGSGGGVHANGDLSITGSANIAQDATAGGTLTSTGTVGGFAGGGQPTVTIPAIHAIDYLERADYILKSDGTIWSQHPVTHAQTQVCAGGACTSTYGWTFGGTTWTVENNNANGTFYVQGDVSINGNHNITITVIAEGSIDIAGNSSWTPDTPELFLVTDGDLDFTGGSDMSVGIEGRVLVREQFRLRGNVTLRGQVVAENAEDTHTLLSDTTILGNVSVVYNGSLGAMFYTMTSWREVR